jgi:membrane protein implicated in regulation of membrane protease activity
MDLTEPVVAAIAALIVLFAPLIPASILFLVFPDSNLALTGPLAKISVRSSGAVALYLILFLLMSQALVIYYNWILRNQQRQQQVGFEQQLEKQQVDFEQQQQKQQLAFQQQQEQRRPVWTLKGNVKLFNQRGEEMHTSKIEQVELDTIPPEFVHTIDNIHLKLPEEETGIPSVIVRIKDFGDNTIKLTYDIGV